MQALVGFLLLLSVSLMCALATPLEEKEEEEDLVNELQEAEETSSTKVKIVSSLSLVFESIHFVFVIQVAT